MDLAPSEALKLVRKWEWQKRKIACLILFSGLDMSVGLNGRVSLREGNIVLTGCGGCGLYLMPVDTLTFSYSSNGYLVINGLGWQCGLWEPDDLKASAPECANGDNGLLIEPVTQ